MHYTFTDVIAVAAFSVIAVIVTVNGGVPQKALFSIEPAGAPKEVPLMSISQRTYVEVDHWQSLPRYSINPYGSSAWITSASSASLKSVEEKPGSAGESVNMYGSTAWVRGNTSDIGKAKAARLSRLAGEFFNPFGSTAWVRGDPSEAVKAEAARLSRLAGEFFNLYGSTAWVRGDPSDTGKAEAARLVAAGKAFGIIPHYISVELASFSNR